MKKSWGFVYVLVLKTFDCQCTASIINAAITVICRRSGWHIEEGTLSLAEWRVTTGYEAVS